jgi:adenylate cyclase
MRRWLFKLGAIFSGAILGMLIGLTPIGFQLEQNFGLRWLFYYRGPINPPPDMVVIGIDDQSGVRLGLSKLPREWPRSIHARLIESLVSKGVSTIVFDFDFQSPKVLKDDKAFAKAIATSNRVILTERLIGKRQPLFDNQGNPKGALWVEQLVGAMPILADAAKSTGTFPLPKIDVAVHEFWAFKHGVDYAPTTPSIAMQLYTQKLYPTLVNLLELAGIKEAASLPRRIEVSARTNDVRELMMKLHQLFEQTPDLKLSNDKIIEIIRKQGLDERQRHWLEALIGLYAGGDNRHLNFYGPPGTIPTLPYSSLLESNIDTAKNLPDLNGKVAFVGYSDPYDPSQPDRFYTVFTNDDGVDLSGVEIAATAFGNLLTNQFLAIPEPFVTASILFFFGAIIGSLAYLLPAIVSIPLMLSLSTGYVYYVAQTFSDHHFWLPLAIPLLIQLPITLFIGLCTQYLSERRKKKWATRAISFYIPKNLAKELTEKNLASSALNKITYSVCFASDMAGFTTISEQLPPKELAVFLNDYFESLSAPLRNNKVDVIEFRADGIMCAWTGEENFSALRRNATLAALDAVDAIDKFKDRHPLLTQQLRIGLETGMVYVGHSGGGGHFVYSIVGDCANTAARIEGLNKKMGTQILASRNTLEADDYFLTRYLGDFQFAGKSEALPILEIMARKEEATVRQLEICRCFQNVMTILAKRQYMEAIAGFEAILADFPDDGPSYFFLKHTQYLAVMNNTPDNPLVIKLDSK